MQATVEMEITLQPVVRLVSIDNRLRDTVSYLEL